MATDFAPILTSFSLSVVSDHCSTVSGNARVRMKFEVIGECMQLEPDGIVA